MPLGIERINVRTAQPNPNINFIKPLEGPSKAHAQDFLERVAAIAVPIMKANHIYVMSLDEFPPNNEFLGRNFNAGEVIQLVLKNKFGGWLPFKFVERVLMHELAHCKQMNHSKAFWQVNNQYCADLKILWDKGYTGEGMWSRGMLLANGDLVENRPLVEGDVPEHLCGGTFRSNRKRKRGATEKEKISYQERQQRRIAKKFGTNGVALGADNEVKAKLEKGKNPVGKPRVAASKRGRELRAAAALARFEIPQISTLNGVKALEGSETESDEEDVKIKPDDAKDIDGLRLVDSDGRGMVKVCEDEGDNADAQKEMEELRNLEYIYGKQSASKTKASTTNSKVVSSSNVQDAYKKPHENVYSASTKRIRDATRDYKTKMEAPLTKAPMTSSKVDGLGNEQGIHNIYKSTNSASANTSGHRDHDKSVRDAARDYKAKMELPRGSSYRHEVVNTDPRSKEINTAKQEVFNILSDYLGDPTCNPKGAIYSGLDAAKASMPRRKSPNETKSVNPSTKAASGFGDNAISRNGVESIYKSRPTTTTNLTSLANVSHNVSSQSVGSGTVTGGKSLSNSAGAANKGVKRDSHGFARAVEKHLREDTIGQPPSPEPTPPNYLANSNRSYGTQSPSIPTSLSNPTKQPVTSSRPTPSRHPLENVTNIPSTQPARPVPQHEQAPTARPSVPRPSTQVPLSAPRPAPVSVPPTPAPRLVLEPSVRSIPGECKVCTTINDAESLTCMVCSNVLHPE